MAAKRKVKTKRLPPDQRAPVVKARVKHQPKPLNRNAKAKTSPRLGTIDLDAIVAEVRKQGATLAEVPDNPACLHCGVRDLVVSWIDDGLVTAPDAVAHVTNSLADLIAWAGEERAVAILGLIVTELPANVMKRLRNMRLGTKARALH